MVLFVLRKLILQTRMRSHSVGLIVWFLVGPVVYFPSACVRTAKALARLRILLRGCADSPKPSLVAYVMSTIISWAGSFMMCKNNSNTLGNITRRLIGKFCDLLSETRRHYVKSLFIGWRLVLRCWRCFYLMQKNYNFHGKIKTVFSEKNYVPTTIQCPKMRSTSPKSNHFFLLSQCCFYASLVKINPLVN